MKDAKPRAALRASTAMEPVELKKAPTGTLAGHEALYRGVSNFVRGNSNFESSVAIAAALDELARATDLNALFLLPLQHKLFSLDAALRWVLFLSIAPDHASEEDLAHFPKGAFTADSSLALILGVYDLGVQEVVWDHFDDDDEDEEEDEEDEEGADN